MYEEFIHVLIWKKLFYDKIDKKVNEKFCINFTVKWKTKTQQFRESFAKR